MREGGCVDTVVGAWMCHDTSGRDGECEEMG